MSTFILPIGFIHCTLTIRQASITRAMLITCAAEIDTPPFDQGNANTLYDDLADALEAVYDPDWTIPQMVTLVGQDGDPGRFVSSGTHVGTRGALNEPPPQVAYILQKRTALSGRRNRGRMYLPASNEANITSTGRLAAGEVTILNGCAGAMYTALANPAGNNTAGPVLLHSEAPSTPTLVTEFEASDVVATQRRRLSRSGAL